MSEPQSPTIVERPPDDDTPARDASPERTRPDLLSVPRHNSSSQLRLGGGAGAAGKGKPGSVAVLHNTDLAKIANEEWQALLKGEMYYCQLVMGNTNQTMDVILNVNLSGIRLLDRKSEEVLYQFDIEQILQYSYSQQHSTFSFSYLKEGRAFVTHKIISKDYLEIHQYLGNAIAIVIKLKTQIKKNGPTETLNILDPQRQNEKNHSVDTLRRSSRAKLYFEQKYKNRGQSSPTESHPEDGQMGDQVPPSPREPDGKASHLTSLFQPFSAPSPATSPPPAAAASSSPAIVGGASSSSSTITSPPAPASSSATTGAPPSSGIKTRFKEYTREHAEAPSAADDKADSPIDDDDRASVSDAHMDSKSIRSIESSMSLSIGQILATKSGDTIRGKKNWTGSLRLTGKNLEAFVGSLRGKKQAPKQPTAEEMEREMKRRTLFSSANYNPEELQEQQLKTDSEGKPRLIKLLLNGQYQITAGTIDGLVEALADENAPDTLFIDDFLLTHRVFTTSAILFEKLLARYNIQPTAVSSPDDKKKKDKPKEEKEVDKAAGELDNNTVALIRARVLSVVKKWVDRHYYDFENDIMREKLNNFINEIKNSDYSIVADQLRNFIAQNEKRKQQQMLADQALEDAKKPLVAGYIPDFIGMDPKHGPMQIAKAMTVVAIKLFKTIQPDSFAIYLWGKKDPKLQEEMTRNLNKFIDRFNKVGFWVATEICQVTNLKDRVVVMERFIQIAKNLYKLQNFNDVIAVLSGLNTIPIYRLKKTWAAVSKEMMAKFRDLEAKMTPESNYKVYRAIEVNAKGDMMPFFALYMKDLTFMNDGMQTWLPGDIVNFEKNRSVMGKIMAIRVSQQSKYEFEGLDKGMLHYLDVMNHKSEEDLTEESHKIEPANRKRAPSISESVNSEVSISTANSEETVPGSIAEVADNASIYSYNS